MKKTFILLIICFVAQFATASDTLSMKGEDSAAYSDFVATVVKAIQLDPVKASKVQDGSIDSSHLTLYLGSDTMFFSHVVGNKNWISDTRMKAALAKAIHFHRPVAKDGNVVYEFIPMSFQYYELKIVKNKEYQDHHIPEVAAAIKEDPKGTYILLVKQYSIAGQSFTFVDVLRRFN